MQHLAGQTGKFRLVIHDLWQVLQLRPKLAFDLFAPGCQTPGCSGRQGANHFLPDQQANSITKADVLLRFCPVISTGNAVLLQQGRQIILHTAHQIRANSRNAGLLNRVKNLACCGSLWLLTTVIGLIMEA